MSRSTDGDLIAFDDMLRSALNAAGALSQDGGKVSLHGPEGVVLRSRAVQTLAMAIHELTANALKHGALKQHDARLDVRWFVAEGKDGRPWLQIDWRETGVAMPQRGEDAKGTGQGRTLIEAVLPYHLAAQTTYALAADGIHCTIPLPIAAQPNAFS